MRKLRVILLIGAALVVTCGILGVLGREIAFVLGTRPFYPTYTAQELWENPLPLPSVINRLRTEVQVNEGFCIEINANPLWHPPGGDPVGYIIGTTSLTIASQVVPVEQMRISTGLMIHPDFNEQGDYIGSHGGPYWVCLEQPPSLQPGLHVATISFRDRIWYDHQWAFRVTNGRAKSRPVPPKRFSRRVSSPKGRTRQAWSAAALSWKGSQ